MPAPPLVPMDVRELFQQYCGYLKREFHGKEDAQETVQNCKLALSELVRLGYFVWSHVSVITRDNLLPSGERQKIIQIHYHLELKDGPPTEEARKNPSLLEADVVASIYGPDGSAAAPSLPDEMLSPESHDWRSNDPELGSLGPRPPAIEGNPAPEASPDVIDLFQQYVGAINGEFHENEQIADIEKKCRTIMDQLEERGYTIASWSNPSHEIISLPSGQRQTVIVIHYDLWLLHIISPNSQPADTAHAVSRIFGSITPASVTAPPDDTGKKDGKPFPQKDLDWLEQNLSWLDEKKP